jgi:branched-chain amino acid transport system substrate-binding protein
MLNVTRARRRFRRIACLAAAPVALAATFAGTGTAGASGLPSTIHLYSIDDNSGPAGAVGVDATQAYQLAVSQINKAHFLGNTTLSFSVGDTGGSATTAANMATQAVSAHYPIVFGPVSSSTAVAVSPIVARANQPTIFTQAGSSGVLVNKYIFRMTPLQTTQFPLTLAWLKGKKVHTISVLYDSDFPTQAQMAQELATLGPKYGIKVVGQQSVLTSQSNISSAVSKLAANHAQAVALLVLLSQNSTAVTDLSQSGFKGPIVAEEGAANGGLNAAGNAANGVTWTSDWNTGETTAASSSFEKAYQAAYHKTATDWSAEAYDAMWFAARGLKAAGSTSPAAIQAALEKVGKAGFVGVEGTVKTVSNQEVGPGILVQYQNGSQVIVKSPK